MGLSASGCPRVRRPKTMRRGIFSVPREARVVAQRARHLEELLQVALLGPIVEGLAERRAGAPLAPEIITRQAQPLEPRARRARGVGERPADRLEAPRAQARCPPNQGTRAAAPRRTRRAPARRASVRSFSARSACDTGARLRRLVLRRGPRCIARASRASRSARRPPGRRSDPRRRPRPRPRPRGRPGRRPAPGRGAATAARARGAGACARRRPPPSPRRPRRAPRQASRSRFMASFSLAEPLRPQRARRSRSPNPRASRCPRPAPPAPATASATAPGSSTATARTASCSPSRCSPRRGRGAGPCGPCASGDGVRPFFLPARPFGDGVRPFFLPPRAGAVRAPRTMVFLLRVREAARDAGSPSSARRLLFPAQPRGCSCCADSRCSFCSYEQAPTTPRPMAANWQGRDPYQGGGRAVPYGAWPAGFWVPVPAALMVPPDLDDLNTCLRHPYPTAHPRRARGRAPVHVEGEACRARRRKRGASSYSGMARRACFRAAGAATAASAASRSRRQCRLRQTARAATARRGGRR